MGLKKFLKRTVNKVAKLDRKILHLSFGLRKKDFRDRLKLAGAAAVVGGGAYAAQNPATLSKLLEQFGGQFGGFGGAPSSFPYGGGGGDIAPADEPLPPEDLPAGIPTPVLLGGAAVLLLLLAKKR